MAAIRSQLNDFQIEEFFNGLLTALQASLNEHLSFDSAEFLARRLDGYERNLNVLLSRLQQAYPGQEQLLENLSSLSRIILQRREFCETLSFRNFFLDDQLAADSAVMVRRPGMGRPRVEITQPLLETLHDNLGFSWAQIARDFGISERTIRRRRNSFGMTNNSQTFSNIHNNNLDQIVRDILHTTPRIGYRQQVGILSTLVSKLRALFVIS